MLIRDLLLTTIFLTASQLALGWGNQAHFIIGDLVGTILTEDEARYLQTILDTPKQGKEYISEHLSSIAALPDNMSLKKYLDFQYYHYAHATPKFETPWRYDKMCGHSANPDHCVVRGVAIFTAILADPTKSRKEREFALEMVVHLMGDIHQPLHLGLWGDLGGYLINNVWPSYDPFRSRDPKKNHTHYNLHTLWDKGLFRHYEEEGRKSGTIPRKQPVGYLFSGDSDSSSPKQQEGWQILADELRSKLTNQAFIDSLAIPGQDQLDVSVESEVQTFAANIATRMIKIVRDEVYRDENSQTIAKDKLVSLAYIEKSIALMMVLLRRSAVRLGLLLKRVIAVSLEKEAEIAATKAAMHLIIPVTDVSGETTTESTSCLDMSPLESMCPPVADTGKAEDLTTEDLAKMLPQNKEPLTPTLKKTLKEKKSEVATTTTTTTGVSKTTNDDFDNVFIKMLITPYEKSLKNKIVIVDDTKPSAPVDGADIATAMVSKSKKSSSTVDDDSTVPTVVKKKTSKTPAVAAAVPVSSSTTPVVGIGEKVTTSVVEGKKSKDSVATKKKTPSALTDDEASTAESKSESPKKEFVEPVTKTRTTKKVSESSKSTKTAKSKSTE